jgi:hypothetical protein
MEQQLDLFPVNTPTEPDIYDKATVLDAMFHYRDHAGTAAWDPNTGLYHGQLRGLQDLVTYEAEDANDLLWRFEQAVDHYLDGDDVGDEIDS